MPRGTSIRSGDSLPHDNHISRGCRDGFDKNTVISTAFVPRPSDDGELSAGWVECPFVPASKRNAESCVERQRLHMDPQVFAILPVDGVQQISTLDGVYRPILEDDYRDECHAAIIGLTGDKVTDFVAQEALAELANRSQIIDRTVAKE